MHLLDAIHENILSHYTLIYIAIRSEGKMAASHRTVWADVNAKTQFLTR